MIEITWRVEPNPLEAEIVVGFGKQARSLCHHILTHSTQYSTQSTSALALLGQSFIALKAPFKKLPWIEGVHYLSEVKEHTKLYIPSHLQPNVPYTWLKSAIEKQAKEQAKEQKNNRTNQKADVLYFPDSNTLVYADPYISLAAQQHYPLLEEWYKQHV